MMTTPNTNQNNHRGQAEIVRELVPFSDRGSIHGVEFDGTLVWFARDGELVAFDPVKEQVARRFAVASAGAGTAFDGTHLYQLAKDEVVVVEPEDGRVVRRFRAPEGGHASGMAWSDGYLFIAHYREGRIHKVDPKTGEVVKTLTSNRFVTGVSCVDGALWHATNHDHGSCELRRLSPDGTVAEAYEAKVASISGIAANGDGTFWCGGEKGTLRLVRPKKR